MVFLKENFASLQQNLLSQMERLKMLRGESEQLGKAISDAERRLAPLRIR